MPLMREIAYLALIVAVISLLVPSCTINKDIMLKTPKDFEFDPMPDTVDPQFKVQPNDFLMFRLFANDGFKIIDIVSSGGNDRNINNRLNVTYLVEYDGYAKLPILGRVKLGGLTVRQAELFLEEKFVEFYNKPFVQLQVINRRVTVFPGDGGLAKVVPLENNNTTIMEVLGSAGGIPKRGNASKVKLIRRNKEGGRDIYFFDLSVIEGLEWGDLVAQADDIIYVEPNPELARELLYDLTPIITLLTTTVLVIGLIQSFQ